MVAKIERADEGTLTARPRRVLHVLPDLAIGGGQTIVWNGIRFADRDSYDIRACHLLPDDEMRPAFLECGVPVTHLGHRPGFGLRTVVRLTRLLRRDRIDIVHVHSDLDRKYAQTAAWAARVPVVGHLHAEWDHLGPQLPRNPSALRRLRARSAATVRNFVERSVVRHYIAESTRVRDLFLPLVDAPIIVLDQAIPIDRFDAALDGMGEAGLREELAIAPTATMLVNVSRLVAGKGHEDLLRAFAAVREQAADAVLVIVGDGDRRGLLQQLAAELHLTQAVVFTGSRDDVPEVLVAGDIFVFASESEGFGIAVLEAMAASLPVVAFGLPAFEEFAVDGVTAELVPLGDVTALAEAVAALIDDPERAEMMGRAGRNLVEGRFRADAVARSFESVFSAALGERPLEAAS
jgi:glycosyltransferase involved in cell wall biosynthesis